MQWLFRHFPPTLSSGFVLLSCLWAISAHSMEPLEQSRLAELEAGFRDGARHDRIWTNTWTTIYGGSTVAYSLVSRNASGADDRFDARVSAVKSALALGNLLLNPQPHRPALQRYRENTVAKVERLSLAETLEQELAQEEHKRHNLQARLLPFAVNLTAGLTIGVIDERPADGATNFAMGMLFSEIAIRTQPDTMSGFGKPVTIQVGEQSLALSYQWFVMPDRVGLNLYF